MTKTILRRVFLLFLLMGIVFACVQEGELFPQKDGLPPEVSDAKAWYESSMNGKDLPWKSPFNSGETNTFCPDWDKAFTNEDSVYQVTEIHRVGKEKLIFVTFECGEKFRKTGDKRYMVSDIRLVHERAPYRHCLQWLHDCVRR